MCKPPHHLKYAGLLGEYIFFGTVYFISIFYLIFYVLLSCILLTSFRNSDLSNVNYFFSNNQSSLSCVVVLLVLLRHLSSRCQACIYCFISRIFLFRFFLNGCYVLAVFYPYIVFVVYYFSSLYLVIFSFIFFSLTCTVYTL